MKRFLCRLLPFVLLFALTCPVRAAEEPIRIAFIDSGISTRHIDPGHVAEGKNYVFPETDTQDRIGHGTAAAGMVLGAADQGVAGVFSQAVAVPLVVVDAYPSGVIENGGPAALCRAIRDAVDEFDCRIINISLSTPEDSEELRSAVAYAESRGTLIVTCAGNDGEDGPVYYPAAYPTTVSVGSAEGDHPASFSQTGADLLADGVGLTAATNKNSADPAVVSGTSYSCAIVSGVSAQLLARYPSLTPEELRQALYSLAADMLEPGYDGRSGWGYLPPDAVIPFPYLDVPADAWYNPAICYVTERGIMNGMGSGTFQPESTMTRAMFAAVLYRMAGAPEVSSGESPFSDVETGAWYADAVFWAAGEETVTGRGDGSFGPEEPATREQLVTILWRSCGRPDGLDNLSGYADADNVSGWAIEAFRWAVGEGVISGKTGGILDPKAVATRAEVAQVLMRHLGY
jgi:subtilisin family serine protease